MAIFSAWCDRTPMLNLGGGGPQDATLRRSTNWVHFPNTHPLDLTSMREQTLRAADVVLTLDVPSLGVPLGPSVRERETLQLAVRPGTKIVLCISRFSNATAQAS